MGGEPKRNAHPYWMHDMINAQPDAIRRVLSQEKTECHQLAEKLQNKKKIHFVGIGTSWHAAVIATHQARQVAQVDAQAWHSFDFSEYPPQLDKDNDAVIIFAHRGTKHFSTSALQYAKKAGVITGLITAIDSKPEILGDYVLRTSEGDKSSAYTISLTCALTVASLVIARLGVLKNIQQAQTIESELEKLPELCQKTIKICEEGAKNAAKSYKDLLNFFIGYGINTAVAYEAALKIKETSYSPCEGLQLEQFLHGPFCGVDLKSTTTFIVPSKEGVPRSRAIMMLKASQKVAKSVTAICREDDIEVLSLLTASDHKIVLPSETCENLSFFPALIAIQLFTYWLSIEYKTNPDIFREDDPAHQNASKIWNLYGLEEKTK